ncbi:MAG: ComEA family DNA-binding protein [Solitalea-like symbiont of Acarus siro]
MNRNIIILFCICITILNATAKAQDVNAINFDNEQVINSILETININEEDQLDEAYISELKDTINYYLKNPININTATRIDFEKLVFISPICINAIINYRQENGSFSNINELNFIDIIDDNTLDIIKHFFTLTSDKEKRFDLFQAIKNSKQEFFSSYYQTLKKAYGYNINNGYLGPNFGFRTFYRVRSPGYIYGNIQLNKVPGAPFGKGSFTSGYVLIKNTGIFKSVHIGDYQLQFGQGLVFWGGYSLNKSYDPINIIKSQQEDVLYNSSLTYGFNRGVTVLLKKYKFSIRPFFSYRGVDANLIWSNKDYKITSISSNSYYRTKSEIDTRNSANELAAGLSVGYRIKPELNVSMLVSSLSYSHDFFHLTYPYKLFQNYDRNKNYISFA